MTNKNTFDLKQDRVEKNMIVPLKPVSVMSFDELLCVA